MCIACTVLGALTALPIPYLSNFWVVSGFIWLFLFLGGFQVPILTGIMISSVPDGLKAFANSTATTCLNLFGFLPAPLIYGVLA